MLNYKTTYDSKYWERKYLRFPGVPHFLLWPIFSGEKSKKFLEIQLVTNMKLSRPTKAEFAKIHYTFPVGEFWKNNRIILIYPVIGLKAGFAIDSFKGLRRRFKFN